ncbi:MAG: hypothetical protein AAGH19_09375 [Pseudomonadota bacterium]
MIEFISAAGLLTLLFALGSFANRRRQQPVLLPSTSSADRRRR